jgi:hypothetical protein
LTTNNVTRCTQIDLVAPGGAASTNLKAFQVADASPYNVLAFYQANGAGQYTIELTDQGGGGCNGSSTLDGVTLNVDGTVAGGDWDANARVYLWDGSSQTIVKDFGIAESSPWDITSLYTGSAQYEVRLETQNGESFRVSNAVMSVSQISCDASNCVAGSKAPPVGDDVVGIGIRLDKGVGANDIDITFDNATCSDDHAVVLWGDIGDYSGYQGTVDVGCDIGAGLNALVTHVGSDIWFNVVWVTAGDAAGLAGFDSSGSRTWNASGLCNVTTDNTTDNVCN